MKKRVMIYSRFGNVLPDAVKQKLERVRAFVESNENAILIDYLYDVGYSGFDKKRPAYRILKEHCKRQDCDTVVVDEYKDLSRDMEELIQFHSMIAEQGIRLVSIGNNDTI